MSLFKRNDYTDYVDLTVGRIYIKPLRNGVYNKITARSTIYSDVLNNAVFFTLMEYELTDLSKKKIDNLSVKDGTKLRLKIKEVLAGYGLINIKINKTDEDFSEEEKKTFKEQELAMKIKLEAKLNGSNSNDSNK